MISFTEAIKKCYHNYANFSGRASRAEYWWFYLYLSLVTIGLLAVTYANIGSDIFTLLMGDVDAISNIPTSVWADILVCLGIMSIWGLAHVVPSIAVGFRRLHDAGFSGWWFLLCLTSFTSIALLVLLLMPSKNENNAYGKADDQDSTFLN